MGNPGKYQIFEQVGSGSVGSVWRARERSTGREVALRRIPMAGSPAVERDRILREVFPCARLAHPHIGEIVDVGVEDDEFLIATEWLAGADLRSYIAQARLLPLTRKIEIVAQIADALAGAHAHGIIHRNLHPGNVFVCDDQTVKVLDFGLAHLPSLAPRRRPVEASYLAPEQIFNGVCDGRADVFSAAVVASEFLTYAHPFQSNFVPRRIAETAPDLVRVRDPQIPEALERLLLQAAAKDPARRPQTADEMAASVREILRQMTAGQVSGKVSAKLEMPAGPPPRPLGAHEALNGWAPDAPDLVAVYEGVRLCHDFEAGLASRDLAAAQAALDELKLLAASDLRLTLAATDGEARLAEALNQPGVAARVAPPPPLPPRNRIAAATAPAREAPAPPLGKKTPTPAAARQWAPEPAAPPAAVPARAPAATVPAGPRKKRGGWPMAVALASVVATAVIAFVYLGPSRVAAVPHVATAVVEAAATDLKQSPNLDSATLAPLRSGDTIRILKVPQTPSQSWVEAQAARDSRYSPPGWVRVSDVGRWTSDMPATSLELLQLFRPSGSAGLPVWEAHLAAAEQFATRFAGSPLVSQARLEIARAEFAVAQEMRNAGRPESEWGLRLERARQALDAAGSNVALAAEVERLRQQAGTLTPPPPPPAAAAVAVRPEELLRRAESAFSEGNYRMAAGWINQLLASQPRHADAQQWRTRIQQAQAAEEKLSK